MITFDAALVFLGALSLPVIYIFIVSRWIEKEYRRDYPSTPIRPEKVAVPAKAVHGLKHAA